MDGSLATLMDPKAVFLDQIPLIERIVRATSRRMGLSEDECAEFESWAKLRLIEDDYAIFRKFERRSALATFLTVVIQHLFQDYRNAVWGRWRPSARAKRLGPLAIRLERLLYRDGCTMAEAHSQLSTTEDPPDSRELQRLVTLLPARTVVRDVGEGALWSVAADGQTDDALLAEESERERRAAEGLVNEMLRDLPAEDQTICRLMYWEGFTVADVARTLHLPQKPLYRRVERLLTGLRAQLESRGIDRRQARRLLVGRGG